MSIYNSANSFASANLYKVVTQTLCPKRVCNHPFPDESRSLNLTQQGTYLSHDLLRFMVLDRFAYALSDSPPRATYFSVIPPSLPSPMREVDRDLRKTVAEWAPLMANIYSHMVDYENPTLALPSSVRELENTGLNAVSVGLIGLLLNADHQVTKWQATRAILGASTALRALLLPQIAERETRIADRL